MSAFGQIDKYYKEIVNVVLLLWLLPVANTTPSCAVYVHCSTCRSFSVSNGISTSNISPLGLQNKKALLFIYFFKSIFEDPK